MTAEERPSFGATDVIEIASKFAADESAFIIGGQATNLWAWLYEDKEPDLKLRGPLTSEDIDCFGSQEAASRIAAALGGRLLLPKIDDATPSTALVITTINGKKLTIDFLGSVLGIQARELRRGVSVVEIAGELDGAPTTVAIKVLHPVLCLKSRIINMLHPALRRRDQVARTQAEAALTIVRRYIHEALDEEDGFAEARECFATLYWYLRSNEYVKVADVELGIDVLGIIKAFADDERIDSRYRQFQLKSMVANIERRRAKRPATSAS
jgi:hypothetical protein